MIYCDHKTFDPDCGFCRVALVKEAKRRRVNVDQIDPDHLPKVPEAVSTIRPVGPMDCVHLGKELGLVKCVEGCRGARLKSFECTVYKTCTIDRFGEGVQGRCRECPKYVKKGGDQSLTETVS